MWYAAGLALVHHVLVFAGLLCAGEHVLSDRDCIVKEATCDDVLRSLMDAGEISRDLLFRPVGDAVGVLTRIETKPSVAGDVYLICFKARRYPSYEFVVVVDVGTRAPIYADAFLSNDGKGQLYGDDVWHFLTHDNRLARWQPPYPPLEVIEIDSLRTRKDGSFPWRLIDLGDSTAVVPAPLTFEETAPGYGAYDVYLEGQRVVSNGGAIFYGVENGP